MRTPEPYFSLPAAADYSAVEHRFMTVNNAGKFVLAGAGSADVVGVMSTPKPKADEQCRVEKGYVDKITAGAGGLALGDKIASDANGKGVAAGAATEYHGLCVVPAAANAIAQFIWVRGKTAA